ncbi:N,N'-diacetylchitobiose phosphorylase [Oscillospiraceae bacterium]|nr:N,N'-diacetylchitobiose phosphorylase [Oscillospiraceae bacterium]BDF73499.1 N,N'-diacetylchitobiose phosphorylase [Oscillospiraceae bacterium]
MQYGHFDNERREYVIDRVDVPVSWTNYLGVEELCAVVNQTAGGYLFYQSPEYHRITRFRPNGVPMDRPGHYIYIRDDDTGEYWSVSWQPCGGDLKDYRCRHGLSYSVYECARNGVEAGQTLFIPRGENVELWDLKLRNPGGRERHLSVYSYAEFSFHQIPIDNQNFQMSLYCAGSDYADGIIDYELFYEHAHQFMAASFDPDGFDCLRDAFLGPYRTEDNPLAVEEGACCSSSEKGGNHCAVLMKRLTLAPGERARLTWMLGEGDRAEGARVREKYADPAAVDAALADLADFWDGKLQKLQVHTPNPDMDTMLNTWTLYQSEINVMFSRFASFIEVGGRTGLGYRDTAQDAMTIPHSNPAGCKKRIKQLLQGLTSAGYGLHLFDPAWFEPHEKPPYKSPTVIPTPEKGSFVHGIGDACADDALWLVAAVAEYIRETGELSFADQTAPYADGGEGTVYEHLSKILDFSAAQVGEHGVCKGLRADWNDCLNLGGGESAMVSFLHYWALGHFVDLAGALGRDRDAAYYGAMQKAVGDICRRELWDGDWYLRGITADGRKIGTHTDAEGRVHLESNTWAVLSGAADEARGRSAMDAVDANLYTAYGLMLNAPSYTTPDDAIGFVTRVYPGVKENGSIFSHPNPWAWCAEAVLGRGGRAMKYYNALCPSRQNDQIEVRQSEPYSYCQFIMGRDHSAFGRARHPFMTGSGGWSYFAATRYILGIRPQFGGLLVDPCVPADWKGFEAVRVWRGATYRIRVENPDGVEKGVTSVYCNGARCEDGLVPALGAGGAAEVVVTMGRP